MSVRNRAIDALLGIAYSEYQWLSQNSRVLYLEYPTRDRKAARVGPLHHQIRLPRSDKAIVSQCLTWNTLLGIAMPYSVQIVIPRRTRDKNPTQVVAVPHFDSLILSNTFLYNFLLVFSLADKPCIHLSCYLLVLGTQG